MNILKEVKTNSKVITLVLAGMVLSNMITYSFAHGGDANLIHGCVRPVTGAIRIVGPNDNCLPNETHLDWNKQGVQGPPGMPSDIPFICPQCNLNLSQIGGETFGNRLKNKDLTNAYMPNVQINGGDFSNTKFVKADISGASINNNSLNEPTIFSSTDFTDATMGVVSANDTIFSNAKFKNAILQGSTFRNNVFTGADFTGANMLGADMQTQNFSNANLSMVNFQNANLTGAVLSGTTLTGAVWNNTTCPDGTNSDNNGSTCIGHL